MTTNRLGNGERRSRAPSNASFAVVLLWVIALSKVSGLLTTPTNETAFTPKTNVWINCGGRSNASVAGLGNFVADTNGAYVSEGILATNSLPSNKGDDPYPTLLEDARIFVTTGSYNIPVTTPGNVWVRLWFYPITFVLCHQTYNSCCALFSVTANEFTLLSNVTTAVIQGESTKYLFVEYLINVQNSLTITFKPEPNGIAFVNGLAVVSAPSNLLVDNVFLVPNRAGNMALNMPTNAVQTMYRLNVGGSPITPVNDSFLTRRWDSDIPYLYGAIIGQVTSVPSEQILYPTGVPLWVAPRTVFGTARTLGSSGTLNNLVNLTWVFPVDPGYKYYVRCHFAEIVYTLVNQRVFNIYLNNQTGYLSYDVVGAAGEADAATFLDFLVDMDNTTADHLWLALSPAAGNSEYNDVILNGLEIFKLNNTDSSLQGMAV